MRLITDILILICFFNFGHLLAYFNVSDKRVIDFLAPAKKLDNSITTLHDDKLSIRPSQLPLLCAVFLKAAKVQLEILRSNMLESKQHCHWIVLIYDGSYSLLRSITDIARQSGVELVSIVHEIEHGTNASSPSLQRLLKPALYQKLEPWLSSYRRVWMLDDDISIIGFSFDKYFRYLDCLFHPQESPLISQGLVSGHQQHFEYLNAANWTGSPVITTTAGFIEQQIPVMDTGFLRWFIRVAIAPFLPLSLKLEADWGFDALWCGAAEVYAKRRLGWNDTRHVCAVITTHSTVRHLHHSWTSVRLGKGIVRGKGRLSQRYYDELADKLQRNNILISYLKQSFPSWYRGGESPEVSPSFRDKHGKFVWPRITELPSMCLVKK